jgi:hypothetical protein
MRFGGLAQMVILLSLMMSGPAFAAMDYRSCILFQFQKQAEAYLLLACDGEKIGERALPSRAPSALKDTELAEKFEGFRKTYQLNDCSENQSSDAWFKSCRK